MKKVTAECEKNAGLGAKETKWTKEMEEREKER